MTKKNEKCLNMFMTVLEAARHQDYTKQGIIKAIRDKRLVAVKKGSQWLISRMDFERFVRSGATNAVD